MKRDTYCNWTWWWHYLCYEFLLDYIFVRFYPHFTCTCKYRAPRLTFAQQYLRYGIATADQPYRCRCRCFQNKSFRQNVEITMGTNCAPHITDLFLRCYESQVMAKFPTYSSKYVYWLISLLNNNWSTYTISWL